MYQRSRREIGSLFLMIDKNSAKNLDVVIILINILCGYQNFLVQNHASTSLSSMHIIVVTSNLQLPVLFPWYVILHDNISGSIGCCYYLCTIVSSGVNSPVPNIQDTSLPLTCQYFASRWISNFFFYFHTRVEGLW